jgi:hypothetical protein
MMTLKEKRKVGDGTKRERERDGESTEDKNEGVEQKIHMRKMRKMKKGR